MAACILKQNLQVVFCHSKWHSLQPFTCSHTLGKDSGGKDPVVHVNVWWIKKTPALPSMHCKCLQSVEVGHDTDKEDEQQHLAKQHRHEFFAETATTHIN